MPPIPEAPRFAPDPRQQRAARVVSGLAHKSDKPETESGPTVRSGFPAAAVDLGALQRVIEDALQGFTLALLAEHWVDAEAWLGQFTRAWVQRCKAKRFVLGEQALQISIETQDDYGHYQYAFEVFASSRRL